MYRLRLSVAFVALFAMVAAASLALPFARQATPAAAQQTPFEMYLDCAPGGAIDDNCVLAPGTTSLDIDVVVKNNSGAAVGVSALGFTVVDDNQTHFVPTNPPCSSPALDCNPDLNQTDVTGGMNCGSPLPQADRNATATVAESNIGCNTGLPEAGLLPAGGVLVIATVHYATTDGFATFSLVEGVLYDDTFGEMMTCNPVIATAGNCVGATVLIGELTTPTATPTFTSTPTPTPTPVVPQPTPATSPTGAVTGVLAINEGTCIIGTALQDIEAVVALTKCQGLSSQQNLQDLIHCLRGFDVDDDGHRNCLIPWPNIPPDDPNYPLRSDVILPPVAADFAPLDRDADQFHYGIIMEIVAFVDGDYPVFFEADRGTFLDPLGEIDPVGATYLCYTLNHDPDCDTDPATVGDGAVVARMRLLADERGDMHVTVTQNGVAVVKTIHVVGPAVTISVEAVNGKDTIETGATAPTEHGATPLDTACDFPGEAEALAGIASPKKTTLLTRALDSDGNGVVGALIQWDKVFAPPFGNPPPSPLGGASLALTPSFDLGIDGIGYPQVICGGSEPGDLVETLSFGGVFDIPGDPSYSRTTTIHVVDPIPPPCPWDVDRSGAITSMDLRAVAMHFSRSFVADADYGEQYDVNADGVINSIDLMLVAQRFGPCAA